MSSRYYKVRKMRSKYRLFDPDPAQRQAAQTLYQSIADLPLLCPHGHVEPRLFANPDFTFGSPVDLLIIPDHYVIRMLYSQGIPLEKLGISPMGDGETKADHRQIWQLFAEKVYLFRGTPSSIWLTDIFTSIFGITEKLTAENAQTIYDLIDDKLQTPAFNPRRIFERCNIELLCTTDAATDSLAFHQQIRESGWQGRILPTFRPDGVININSPNWRENIYRLETITNRPISNFKSFVVALEERRTFFKEMGAVAADHSALTPFTTVLSAQEAESIFQRALQGEASADDARRFTGHMLIEMARMSVEDGLVMQMHVGAYRNHNVPLYGRFGADIGADIPVRTEFTRNLAPLIQQYGNNGRFSLILFTLDETTYARELAPLAGHYPAIKLGPPWWFHDSLNGMRRYFDQVMETAGLYNTVGFNDDTRALLSIPARHDMWRRVSVNWLAALVVRGIVDMEDASAMAYEMAYGLAQRAYKLE